MHTFGRAKNALIIEEGYGNQRKQRWGKHREGKITWRRQSHSEKSTRRESIHTEATQKLIKRLQTQKTRSRRWENNCKKSILLQMTIIDIEGVEEFVFTSNL